MRAIFSPLKMARLFLRRSPMKIVIDQPCFVRANLQPGDEISVSVLTPELETLLRGERLDGKKVAHLVDDGDESETATIPHTGETATTNRGRTRERSAAAVSR